MIAIMEGTKFNIEKILIMILSCIQALYEAMERVKTSLETEQEKLATLVKNLSVDPSQTEGAEKGEEPAVSEEWLQSLKERRKVRVW